MGNIKEKYIWTLTLLLCTNVYFCVKQSNMTQQKFEIYFTPGEYDFAKDHLKLEVIKKHGMMILCQVDVSGLHEIWHTAVKYSLKVLKP